MFGKDKKDDSPQKAPDANANNILGRGTRMTGELEAAGNFRLEGHFNGKLTCKAKVVLGETAKMQGELTALNAEIAGQFEGDININDVLVVRSTAKITGTLITKKLMVEAGATLVGQCQAGEQPTNQTNKTPDTKPKQDPPRK